MPTCPHAHPSRSTDYCDVCGTVLTPEPPTPQAAPPSAAPARACVRCGGRLPAGAHFCEQCGEPAEPEAPGAWSVTLTPDRSYYETRGGDAHGFDFPASHRPRHIALTGDRVRIGRHSVSRQVTPEIDLSQQPADPGVSREHALLIARPDGSWAVMDTGSANGTFLNDNPQRIPPQHEVPLSDGDRVHVGVWTTLTLLRDTSEGHR
ncbi:MAG: FHA domain-containing protein [Pseudonocardia sp.]